MNRGPEQAAFQRDAQRFFENTRPLQNPVPEQFQRSSLPPFQSRQPEEDWNEQFQKVSISGPPPSQFLSSNQLGKQPALNTSSTWHEEFTRFQAPAPQHFSYQPQVQQRLASVAYTTSLPFDQTSLYQAPKIDSQFDDEAFELAFAEAENAIQSPAPAVEHQPEAMVEEEPKLSEKEEGDRLAQTAGELFDSLQYERDTNEKFRKSTFMLLMRKLRDREVVVAGNDMVQSSRLTTNDIAEFPN